MSSSFVGKGATGCVYYPPLECIETDKQKDIPKSVGKVSYTKYAEDEWKRSRILSEIDANQKYMIYPRDFCYISKEVLPTNTCKLVNNNDHSSFTQLLMRNGGITLKTFIKNEYKITRPQLLHLLLYNAVDAIQMLIKNQLIHQDIKTDNIVIDISDKNITRIIDFGQLVSFGDYYNPSQNDMLDNVKNFSAPECKLAYTYMLSINTQNELYTYFGIIYNDTEQSTFYNEYIKAKKDAIEFRRSHNTHLKLDVYALGLVFLEMEVCVTDRAETPNLYKELMKGMLHPNPDIRFTIDQVISKITEILFPGPSSGGTKPRGIYEKRKKTDLKMLATSRGIVCTKMTKTEIITALRKKAK